MRLQSGGPGTDRALPSESSQPDGESQESQARKRGGGKEGFLAGSRLEGLVEAGKRKESLLDGKTSVNKCGVMGMSNVCV